MKIKNLFLILMLLSLININLNALTMKEKIQQDLSKIGVKKEIIDETIFWDRMYATEDTDLPLDIDNIINTFEKIYEKDKRNYVAARKILQFSQDRINYDVRGNYGEKIKNAENEEEKKFYEEAQESLKKDLAIYKKYYDTFMTYNPYEHEKLLVSYNYYLSTGDLKKAEEIEKTVRTKYKNTIIDKMILTEGLQKGMTKYYKLGRLIEKKVNEELAFIENDRTKEKYRVSDEEIYNLQLIYYIIKIWTYLYSIDRDKGIEIAINELDDIKASENAKEYNFRVENGILHWLLITGGNNKNYAEKILSMKMQKRTEKMYDWVQEEEDRIREKHYESLDNENNIQEENDR